MKIIHKIEPTEEFFVEFQNVALKIHPTPFDKPVVPVGGSTPNDHDRFDRETRESQNKRNFSQLERERHKFQLLKEVMTDCIRLKVLEKPEDATIQGLSTKAREN